MQLQGKYCECETMAREALRIIERVVGKEHKTYAIHLIRLVSLLRGQVGTQGMLSLVVLKDQCEIAAEVS